VLLAATAFAWWEVFLAARGFHAIDPLPPVMTLNTLSRPRLERAIAEATEAAALRPDDSNLQQRLGELWVFRYRLAALETIPTGQQKPETYWPYTNLERLYALVAELERQGDRERLQLVRNDPAVVENLHRARLCFLRAQTANRWSEDAAEFLAQLTVILDGDVVSAESWLRRAAADVPNVPDDLIRIGALAKMLGRRELAMECFSQAVRLDPERRQDVARIQQQE
jgi:tetratricopeptide (TPR) repeat protein